MGEAASDSLAGELPRAAARRGLAVSRGFASEAAALDLASSEIRMLLRTLVAPLVLAIRVMAPLRCMTLVFPSIVTTPFSTETLKWSALIFDLASLVLSAYSMRASSGVFVCNRDGGFAAPATAAEDG
jgi:hypothetical protein